MLIQVNKVDTEGYIIEPVVVNEDELEKLPDNFIKEPVPEPMYIPKWDFENKRWIEGATQEYIDELENKKNEVSELAILETEFEQLKRENEMLAMAVMELSTIILNGGK